MKKIYSIIVCMFLLLSMSMTSFAQEVDYTETEYSSDLKVLREILEKNHGDLYESIAKEKLDGLFEGLEAEIDDSMTLQDFYYEISKIIYSINDGHTYLIPSGYFIQNTNSEKTYLPLKVKFIDKIMYCDYASEYLPLGAEILEINDKKVSDIMSRLKYFMASESSDETAFSYSQLERRLPYIYPQLMEVKKEHKIKFKDPENNEVKTVTIRSEDINIGQLQSFSFSNYIKGAYAYSDQISERVPVSAEFDSGKDAAVLRIYTFAPEDHEMFISYVDKFFEDVKYNDIGNVIFDVRGNTGGESKLLGHVLSYVYQEDFHVIKNLKLKRSDVARTDLLNEEGNALLNELKQVLYEAEKNNFKLADGSYDLKYEKEKPAVKNNFDGNVYVLADGGSFSCGSIFPQKIQKLKNGYFIGTESSGNYYETTAGNFIRWELPNTKITINVPVFQTIIEDETNKDIARNSGVKPDYEVKLKYEDYIKGIDTQLEFIYDLIEKQK